MVRNRNNPALDLPLDQIDFERVLDASIRFEVANAELESACLPNRVAVAGEFLAAAFSALNSNWADYLRNGYYAREMAAIDARHAAAQQVAA